MRFYRYIIGLVLLLSVVVISPDQAEAFTDTDGHWAGMQIEHLQSREIITGYPDGSYHPESYISRQEFVVLLIRAINKQKEAEVLQKGTVHFDDGNTWAKGYIELAHEMNLVQGDRSGSFSPARSISREEAVSILIKCLTGDISPKTEISFKDRASISAWAYPSVTVAVERGLIKGFPDDTFRPGSYLTRAQVAAMLESLLKGLGREHQISGTITQISLPSYKATVIVDGRQENFELAANVKVWSQETNQPQTEIPLPADACFDLNSNGKLSYILITNPDPKISQVKFAYSRLLDANHSGQVNSSLQALIAGEEDTENLVLNDQKATASLLATGEAMGAQVFASVTGATGKGQLVAVIDSGVDPGHPDLRNTSQGYKKIVDFIDLSDEGKVALNTVKASGGYLTLGNNKVEVDNLPDKEGPFKVGYLNLDFLPDSTGLASRDLLVVLTASKPGGGYDTAYFDTNGDGQIKDETGFKKYSLDQQVVSIKGDGGCVFNFVVCDFSDKDNYIRLGFDGFGHGTEVAGVVAASGKVKGIAPDAQLLVVKIADSGGSASLKNLESALSLAADRGAGVAVVSMGQNIMTDTERESLAKTASLIWKSKGMIICMAAGNNGPGLETVADSTGINHILTVGAYATPKMWATDYGWAVPDPTLWYFSSTGPASNAAAAPLLLAPGSAVSTYPMWNNVQYHLNAGTSIAAPHLAGAVALLLDANAHRLYRSNAAVVFQAILASAKPVKGLQPVEQGYGTVNLPGAWQELQKNLDASNSTEGKQYSPGVGLVPGFYSRGSIPASIALHITNNGDAGASYSLGGFADWIKPEQYSLQVPAHSERVVDIKYDTLDKPGLYSSFLAADDINSSGLDAVLPQTVVVPQDMSKTRDIEQSDRLEPGALKHYFFRVPDGGDQIIFKLSVKNGKGRAKIYVISPDGIKESSTYVGVGAGQNVESASMSYSNPATGIWEVVIYSSASLSDYSLQESDYLLKTSLTGNGRFNLLPPDDYYFVSTAVPDFTPGNPVNLTLFFWNRGSKLPASGLVSIDGRLYEIENGMVTLAYTPLQDNITLHLAW